MRHQAQLLFTTRSLLALHLHPLDSRLQDRCFSEDHLRLDLTDSVQQVANFRRPDKPAAAQHPALPLASLSSPAAPVTPAKPAAQAAQKPAAADAAADAPQSKARAADRCAADCKLTHHSSGSGCSCSKSASAAAAQHPTLPLASLSSPAVPVTPAKPAAQPAETPAAGVIPQSKARAGDRWAAERNGAP